MGTVLLEEPAGKRQGEFGLGVEPRTDAAKTTADWLRTTFCVQPWTFSTVDWTVLGWMTLMHAGCLLAPFYFTWSAFSVAVLFYWLTGCVGICLGYHRYLAHRSLKLSRPAEFFVYLCGVLALEGSPLMWASTHRVHHARSDKDGDPHSPRHGKWWSHILWLFQDRVEARDPEFRKRIVPDLIQDPMIQFFDRTFFWWTVLFGVIMYTVGGMPWLIWGLCVRMVFTYHVTWFVNSATHLWGYRNYQTTDDSRNLWWVALLASGEGWHNNHHAYPRLARAGHKWWEFDVTFLVIRLLQATGQAWDVADGLPDTTRRSSPARVA